MDRVEMTMAEELNWEPFRAWFDNPIFIKHVRSRLRPQPLAAAAVVVIVLCICIAWAGYQLDSFANGRAFEWLVVLQGIIVIILGGSQLSAAVGGSRASGILDFHRVSPLTPTELTLGFFFGGPIREYVLFVCTLPFAALFLAFGVPSVHGFVQIMILLLAIAWLFHGLALISSLIKKGHRSARGAVGIVVVFVLLFFNTIRMGRLVPSVALFDEDARLTLFGYPLPWLAVVLIYIASVLYFSFLAARRKMASERIHPLSKIQAIAALSVLAVLLLGGIWQQENELVLKTIVLYLLVVTAILALLIVTPDRAEYAKGLWRAKKHGRPNLPWWNDLSLNRVFLVIACSIVLVAATAAWHAPGGATSPDFADTTYPGNLPLAIAIGVLVVAYFGLAHQYFLLNFGGRGKTYFALFLFLAWLLPLVSGTILAMSSGSGNVDARSQVVYSLSPIPGIGMVAAPGSQGKSVQGAAITPPLLFTFVFNSLLTSARRRAYKHFLTATGTNGRDDPPAETHVAEPAPVDHVARVANLEVSP
jgi:hypothetical protein